MLSYFFQVVKSATNLPDSTNSILNGTNGLLDWSRAWGSRNSTRSLKSPRSLESKGSMASRAPNSVWRAQVALKVVASRLEGIASVYRMVSSVSAKVYLARTSSISSLVEVKVALEQPSTSAKSNRFRTASAQRTQRRKYSKPNRK